MKRKLFIVVALISTLFCCPALAQDATKNQNEYEKENYKVYAEAIPNITKEFVNLIYDNITNVIKTRARIYSCFYLRVMLKLCGKSRLVFANIFSNT